MCSWEGQSSDGSLSTMSLKKRAAEKKPQQKQLHVTSHLASMNPRRWHHHYHLAIQLFLLLSCRPGRGETSCGGKAAIMSYLSADSSFSGCEDKFIKIGRMKVANLKNLWWPKRFICTWHWLRFGRGSADETTGRTFSFNVAVSIISLTCAGEGRKILSAWQNKTTNSVVIDHL